MKILKKILLTVIILALVFVIIAWFLPQNIEINRQIKIDAPARVVFNQVNDLRSWQKWAVWNQIDPDMKISYEKLGIGQGAGYHWESENEQVGKGSLFIETSVPYDSILIQLSFDGHGDAQAPFYFTEENKQTNVSWSFKTDLGNNPLLRWMGLLFDSMIGPDLEKGLENLKVVAETIYQEKQPLVELQTLPEMNYISVRDSVVFSMISAEMARMYGDLYAYLQKEGLQMADVPYAIYHKIDGDIIDLECGIPVLGKVAGAGDILAGTMPSRTYAEADHIGAYETLGQTHEFIQQWLKSHNIVLAGSPMEKYLTDPYEVTDTTQWITAVFYPVAVE
ncbi:SRPBCC family protein [Mangrovibacterium diazotrophicum]|uniref:Effector-binding domain-containing protein n=1 Tax=Mangrovibacterium diazotrophicum TaxID=1261403 RepID=A0A419W8M4_9BACT|nr:GyrI-like domain-containing protein [Mangrovibacterium diazotrophicum]RKD91805.1 effector-binding domain-containing protein [Mangrovibacterium diazotrophicum]